MTKSPSQSVLRKSNRIPKPRREYQREQLCPETNNREIEFHLETECGLDQPDPQGAKCKDSLF